MENPHDRVKRNSQQAGAQSIEARKKVIIMTGDHQRPLGGAIVVGRRPPRGGWGRST